MKAKSRRRHRTIGRASRTRFSRGNSLLRPRLTFELLEDRRLLSTVTWINPAGGDWSVANNWLDASTGQNRVPAAGDDVVINESQAGSITITHTTGDDSVNSLTSNQNIVLSGGSISIAAASEITSNLTLSGGTLAGAGTLTVDGNLDWSDGTMSGSGSTVVAGGGTLAISGYYETLDGRTLMNYGTATLNGTGTWYLSDGATFDNEAGATLSLLTNEYLYGTGAVSTVVNAGTIDKTAGAGTSEFFDSLSVSNTGLLEADSGTLDFNLFNGGSASSQGVICATANGSVQIDGGSLALQTGASLTGAGALSITGGEVDIDGADVTATNVDFSGGTLAGAGTLTVSGVLQWSGGTMSGSGSTVVTGGGTLTIDGYYETLEGQTLLNYGTATLNGTGTWYLNDGATFDNEAGATLSLLTNEYLYGTGTVSTVVNAGTIDKTAGAGTSEFFGALSVSNTGLLEADSGTLDFNLFNGGSASSQGVICATANGTVQIDGGLLALQTGASLTGAGELSITGGEVDIDGANVAATNVDFSGGTLAGAGTLTVSGVLQWSGGTMSGSGSTVVAGGGTLTIGGYVEFLDGRTLINYGTATLNGTGAWYLSDGATFVNEAGATLSLLTNEYLYGESTTVSTVVNAGTIDKTAGTGTSEFFGSLSVSNTGLLEADSGTLDFNLFNGGSASSQGVICATANGTVQIDGGLLALQTDASLTGAGALSITGGEVDVDGADVTATNVDFSGGTLAGTGTLNVSGALQWSGGTMGGSGSTVVTSGGTLTIGGYVEFLDGRTLMNYGTATLNGTGAWYLNDGATFVNEAVATLSLLTNEYLYGESGTVSTVVNAGTIDKTAGTGTSLFFNNISLSNSGTLEANSGTLDLGNSLTNFSAGTGTLTGGTYAATGTGALAFANANIVALSAAVVLDGPASQIVADNSNNSALANLSQITSSGSLTLEDGSTLSVAAISDQGNVTVGAGSTLTATGQYASYVIGYSSQYSSNGRSAAQAIGPPNVTSYGDNPDAWAPSSQSGTQEYLTLGFATPIYADGVSVRETDGNGFRDADRPGGHVGRAAHRLERRRSKPAGRPGQLRRHLANDELSRRRRENLRRHEPRPE
jgi:hypothetical protein